VSRRRPGTTTRSAMANAPRANRLRLECAAVWFAESAPAMAAERDSLVGESRAEPAILIGPRVNARVAINSLVKFRRRRLDMALLAPAGTPSLFGVAGLCTPLYGRWYAIGRRLGKWSPDPKRCRHYHLIEPVLVARVLIFGHKYSRE
jgi:hypothetical protein